VSVDSINLAKSNTSVNQNTNSPVTVSAPNISANSSPTPPNFNELPQDTVQIAGKETTAQKKKLSKGAKWAIGIGGTFAALVTAALLYSRHQYAKISKIYKEKLITKTFKEKLDFKEAKSIEEAIKYAKETLGIKEVDKDFSLEALNTVNKGVTDVVNKSIGQEVFLPTKYTYTNKALNGEIEATYTAFTSKDINSKCFGQIGINKNYFDDSYLTKQLKELFHLDSKAAEKTTKEVAEKSPYRFHCKADKQYHELVAKFKKDPNSLSIKEKRILLFANKKNRQWAIASQIGDRVKVLEELEQQTGKNLYDKEVFKKLTFEEQLEKLKTILKDNELQYEISIHLSDGTETIYHELGHLQDYAKNLKELDCAKWKPLDLKKIWHDAENKVQNGVKATDRYGIDEIRNHWGGSEYKGYKELLKKDPKKFKKLYPDLYEHLTNQDIHKTAGKISAYAQTGIGEFIAETYAKMICGEKLPDDVITLYKKYNGPIIAGY